MYIGFLKPLIDFTIAILSIIVLSPVFILVGIAVKLDSKGPVFFLQNRIGKNGKVFRIYKFRSMRLNEGKDVNNTLYENDPRITKVGAFIRKTSLDEIPQLINIIKGDMSFIGPRPPVMNYPKKYHEYSDFERKRFMVKPGISGLAQMKCREVNDWRLIIPIDIEYVENQSLKLDSKLFFFSLFTFFKTDNIYTPLTNDRE